MESEEQVPEYLDFETLQDTSETFDAIAAKLHSDNWRDNFEALNSLRKVNKFRKPELVSVLAGVIEKVLSLVDTPRSSLAKQSLIFLTEAFSLFHEGLVPIVLKLSPLLLVKSTNEKAFLKQEAGKAIQRISENFYMVPEIVEVFRSNCFHKSAGISTNAYNCLTIALSKLPEDQVFDICLSLESCSRQSIKTGAKSSIKGLSVTWADFGQRLASLDEGKRKIVEACLAEKGRRVSLREQRLAGKNEKKQEEVECVDNN